MPFAQCLNRICMNPPEEDSEDDIMLQSREISIGHDHKDYPLKAMHVYAKNSSCDEWNEIMLNSLDGNTFMNTAKDCRKDTGTNLANIAFPANPKDTSNLCKTLSLKVHAHVMITTNIDVSDGLTNGAMGTVTDIVMDSSSAHIKAVLVAFDIPTVGEHAKAMNAYKHINCNSVPIEEMQVNFCVDQKSSCQGTRKQFPLTLCWAVTIHKCQGLTLDEIVVDMSPAKGHYRAGQAYVAFSRV